MINLRVQVISTGKFLVMKPDGTTTIELHSTMFNDQGDLLGSFAYPGEMPAKPNRAMLQNAHYISTSSKLRTVMVMMWLGPVPWKQVKMNFTFQDDIIQYNLYIDMTIIGSQLSQLGLNQLFVEGAGTEIDTAGVGGKQAFMKATCTAAPGTYPMVFFPFRNTNAYKTVSGLVTFSYKGTYDAATSTPPLHDADGDGALPPGVQEGWIYGPSTSSGSVNLGQIVDGSPVDTAVNEGDYLVYDGDGQWYTTDNPYGVRVDGYSNLAFPYNPLINCWEMDELGNGSFKVDPPGGPYNQTQVPFFYITAVLQRIADYLGYNLQGKVLTDAWFQKLVIGSRVSIGTGTLIADMVNYLPDVSVPDFIKALRTDFGIMVDFDLTTMIMMVESLQNIIADPAPVDLRANQVKSFRETTNNTTYYLITQNADGDDTAFPSGYTFPQQQIGDPNTADTETDIPLTSVATLMISETAAVNELVALDTELTPPTASWRIPQINVPIAPQVPFDQIGQVDAADANNFKLRFLIWQGMQPNSAGFIYPYGSVDSVPVIGDPVLNLTLSLQPNANDFQPLGYYYNYQLNSKPFELGVNLNLSQLATLSPVKRYLVSDPYGFNAISAVLDQNASDLQQNQSLIPSKITLYPWVQPSNTAPIAPVVTGGSGPPVVDNGVVYVRMALVNPTETEETEPTPSNNFYKDILVSFFADSAGTTPKNVTDLLVGIRTEETINIPEGPDAGTETLTSFNNYTCSGTSQTVAAAPVAQNFTEGDGENIVWVYTLLSSAYYTIIS